MTNPWSDLETADTPPTRLRGVSYANNSTCGRNAGVSAVWIGFIATLAVMAFSSGFGSAYFTWADAVRFASNVLVVFVFFFAVASALRG